jgi:lipopolysaccharide biosynthesis protein
MNKPQTKTFENQLQSLRRQLEEEIENHRKTKIKLKMREHENHAITQSRSYKLARILADTIQVTRILVGHIRSLSPQRRFVLVKNRRHVLKAYRSSAFTKTFTAPKTADTAVIIHLYYTEMLPIFLKRLEVLKGLDYDLYLTVPEHKEKELNVLCSQAPHARIAVVPNCGRDVLPFVQVMKHTEHLGYEKILKLHTKKSPHRADGDKWRDRLLSKLLPTNLSTLQEILKVLDHKNTALVGPSEEYVSLLVNFNATATHLKKVLKKSCGDAATKKIFRHPDEYGFFGGTMFWARCDALLPILDAIEAKDFEVERGQEDSTLAHALERIFNVVPEIRSMDMYEVGSDYVAVRPYETTNIPSWAEYSIDA